MRSNQGESKIVLGVLLVGIVTMVWAAWSIWVTTL